MQFPEYPDSLNPIDWRSTVPFFEFYGRLKDRPDLNHPLFPEHLISIDPGETTGIAIMHPDHRYLPEHQDGPLPLSIAQFQINTSIIEWGIDKFNYIIPDYENNQDTLDPLTAVAIIESYRIYAWRTKQHTWQSLLTPRLIGVVETLCRLRRIPLIKQSAQQGKSFVSDDRLKEWGLYIPGRPHAMDATRHLCNHLLFGDLI